MIGSNRSGGFQPLNGRRDVKNPGVAVSRPSQ